MPTKKDTQQTDDTPVMRVLNYRVNKDTKVRTLLPEHIDMAVEPGVTETWSEDWHDVMVNRAKAHFYELQEVS